MAINKKELEKVKKLFQKLAKQKLQDKWGDIDWDRSTEYLENYMRFKFSSGGYAGVFIPTKKKYVIKMIVDGSNDGYTKYAKFCLKNHKKFPNLPKVYAIFKSRGYQFFVIEKLSHNMGVADRFEKNYDKYLQGDLKRQHKFYSLFEKLTDKFGFSLNDVGGHNVMIRKGGIAVLTDPIAD
jgi:hypothetical protein